MLDYFDSDDETNDGALHKQIREQVKWPVDTEGDKPSSREEITSVIIKFNPKMALGGG